jgi:hypothetical protein
MALLSGKSGTEIARMTFRRKEDVSAEPPRIGVFACYCHPTIDTVVDVDGVLA